jgi:outer membrane protein assembly factor BamB
MSFPIRRRLVAVAVVALLGAGPDLARAQAPTQLATAEWPQFLGPDRNGISRETGLVDSFPADGPKKVWRVAGGIGMSGLVVSRGRVLTMIQKDGKQWLAAFDAATGASAWQTELAPAYENGQGAGPRATPAVSGDRVFALTGEGILAAVSFADGKIIWSHNLPKELGGAPAEYGMASSPLVVGEQVVVMIGAPKGSVVALDAASGNVAWTAGNEVAGYSSPTLLDVGGKRQIVLYTGTSVIGIQPGTGKLLWRYPYETDFACNIAVPLAIDGKVFISAGENHGSALLELKPAGDGFEPQVAWESQGPTSKLRNEWQTSIVLDGRIYGFDNVGGAGPITHLTCLDAATGERLWQKLRFGKGNMIEADGKLWIAMITGELVLVRVNPKEYEELGRAQLLESTRQAPTLAGGLLYLRDGSEIVCVDVRK